MVQKHRLEWSRLRKRNKTQLEFKKYIKATMSFASGQWIKKDKQRLFF